jgi:hypothetical protein
MLLSTTISKATLFKKSKLKNSKEFAIKQKIGMKRESIIVD